MSVRVGVSLNEIAIWFWFFLYCGIPTQGRRFTKLVLSLSILKGVCQCTCTCDTDGLPLSWEIYYQACSTRCLSNFPSLTGTLKTDKKRGTFRPFLGGIRRWGAYQVLPGVPLECDPGLYHAFPCLHDLGMKGKVYGTYYYRWNCDLTWS